jgi:GNAT superfamily N-acetyltransferase
VRLSGGSRVVGWYQIALKQLSRISELEYRSEVTLLFFPRPALKTAKLFAPLVPSEVEALSFLLPLSEDYPGIADWYRDKVVPGLRDGTRHLLRIERDGTLAGIGIAKNVPGERKICTVRVAPAYANRGIGVRIFDGLLKWLDDDRPHLTVSDHKLALFERIFDYYGFHVSSARQGQYVPHAVELGYNETGIEASYLPGSACCAAIQRCGCISSEAVPLAPMPLSAGPVRIHR